MLDGRWLCGLALLAAAAACGEEERGGDDDDGGNGGTGGAGAAGAAGPTTATTSAGGAGGGVYGVCERWKDDRADLSEGSWSGAVASCEPGDIAATGRENALRVVNLYRWLAGLPAVMHEASRNQEAQACALMMDANDQLSHTPTSDWSCYTSGGASAAGKSNIATTAGVTAVDLYMADPGNDTTIGHRRWILNNQLGPIGLGSTDSYSCMMVIGGSGSANAPWTAFPSPGPFPLEAMNASFVSVDETGWTVQSDSIDLGAASVSVTEDGVDRPVTVTQLLGGYGSTYAIRFNPQGWTSQAGHTYHVEVSGVSSPISYDVEIVQCQ